MTNFAVFPQHFNYSSKKLYSATLYELQMFVELSSADLLKRDLKIVSSDGLHIAIPAIVCEMQVSTLFTCLVACLT
jgi:hypothetical protein